MITSLHLLQWLSDLATPRADGPERVKVGPTGSYRGKAPDFARGEESRMCGSTLISYISVESANEDDLHNLPTWSQGISVRVKSDPSTTM